MKIFLIYSFIELDSSVSEAQDCHLGNQGLIPRGCHELIQSRSWSKTLRATAYEGLCRGGLCGQAPLYLIWFLARIKYRVLLGMVSNETDL